MNFSGIGGGGGGGGGPTGAGGTSASEPAAGDRRRRRRGRRRLEPERDSVPLPLPPAASPAALRAARRARPDRSVRRSRPRIGRACAAVAPARGLDAGVAGLAEPISFITTATTTASPSSASRHGRGRVDGARRLSCHRTRPGSRSRPARCTFSAAIVVGAAITATFSSTRNSGAVSSSWMKRRMSRYSPVRRHRRRQLAQVAAALVRVRMSNRAPPTDSLASRASWSSAGRAIRRARAEVGRQHVAGRTSAARRPPPPCRSPSPRAASNVLRAAFERAVASPASCSPLCTFCDSG